MMGKAILVLYGASTDAQIQKTSGNGSGLYNSFTRYIK